MLSTVYNFYSIAFKHKHCVLFETKRMLNRKVMHLSKVDILFILFFQCILREYFRAGENVENLNNKRLVNSAQFPHVSVVLAAMHSLAILSPLGLFSFPARHISLCLSQTKRNN